jgi:hypothetical protein
MTAHIKGDGRPPYKADQDKQKKTQEKHKLSTEGTETRQEYLELHDASPTPKRITTRHIVIIETKTQGISSEALVRRR